MARRKKSVIHQREKGLANHGHGYYLVVYIHISVECLPQISVQNIQWKTITFFFLLYINKASVFFIYIEKLEKCFSFCKGFL